MHRYVLQELDKMMPWGTLSQPATWLRPPLTFAGALLGAAAWGPPVLEPPMYAGTASLGASGLAQCGSFVTGQSAGSPNLLASRSRPDLAAAARDKALLGGLNSVRHNVMDPAADPTLCNIGLVEPCTLTASAVEKVTGMEAVSLEAGESTSRSISSDHATASQGTLHWAAEGAGAFSPSTVDLEQVTRDSSHLAATARADAANADVGDAMESTHLPDEEFYGFYSLCAARPKLAREDTLAESLAPSNNSFR